MILIDETLVINESNILYAERDVRLGTVKVYFIGGSSRLFEKADAQRVWLILSLHKQTVKVEMQK